MGLFVPLTTILINQVFPFKYNFTFLAYNPFSWIFIFPAKLCQSDLCGDLFLVVGFVFTGWAILGGVIGILLYWIKKKLFFSRFSKRL